MKIRTKLALILVALLILAALLIWMGNMQIQAIKEKSEALKENFNALMMTEEILVGIKNKGISMRNTILFEDAGLVAAQEALIKESENAIAHNLYELKPLLYARSPEHMENLEETVKQFNAYADQVLHLAREGKKEEAIALINRDWQRQNDNIYKAVDAIVDMYEKDTEASINATITESEESLSNESFIAIFGIVLVLGFAAQVIWRVAERLKVVSSNMLSIANGSVSLSTRIESKSKDEIDAIADSFNQMAQSLELQVTREQQQAWLKSNVTEIAKKLNGIKDLESLSEAFLSQIAPLLEVCHAVFFLRDERSKKDKTEFQLMASYALNEKKHPYDRFAIGEGLIGQAAMENSPILLTDVPSNYVQAISGLGEASPLNLYILPISFDGSVNSVVEIASFKPFTQLQLDLLHELADYFSIILENVKGSIELTGIYNEAQAQLEEIRVQSEELQAQQEELRSANEMLEKQTEELRQSKEIMQVQQEELEQINEELRNKTEILQQQNMKLEAVNSEVAAARQELEEKAKNLALVSQYKSEFLANMSHELRTPLNSLTILSKLLADNPEGNLTEKQVEFSKTIHSSAADLLDIINDILDLSKIESGKMDVHPGKVNIRDVAAYVRKSFEPIAQDKNLKFNVNVKETCPDSIYSDESFIEKILVNLLSNAFKFTHQGEVTLEIAPSGNRISFAVSDTGIGIPKDKQELIFEAFQQADGTKSRKYGGTGLGLSISRELAEILGGEIQVSSEVGKGSTFTFCVGDYHISAVSNPEGKDPGTGKSETGQTDTSITERITIDRKNNTVSALPEVNSIAKTQEKNSVVPVKKAAPAKAEKNGRIISLLIVEDDLRQRNSLMELIGSRDVIITAVSSAAEAIEQLKVHPFDCIILDLGLSDMSGFELLERIDSIRKDNGNLMIFIYTGRDLSSKEELFLKKYAHTIIIKDSFAPQRLIDELDLYLRSAGNAGEEGHNEEMETAAVVQNGELAGKNILIVDDDARNVYALSSMLERYGMVVSFAENGLEALELLKGNPEVDLILMDIMMPEMDGLEAITRIRAMEQYKNKPIIALTAKAMKEDREDCMNAGASDYIAKPVDSDRLISLIKVWLYNENKQLPQRSRMNEF